MFVPCVLSNDAIDALKRVCPKSDADTDVAIADATDAEFAYELVAASKLPNLLLADCV